MQKVLTVTSHTNIIDKEAKFTEREYPTLDKYLKEGYRIIQTIPIVKPADTSYMYAITFILEK
jgi:HD-GYP domain-containing protein (c-di-GMP phosphodiesterase class II)